MTQPVSNLNSSTSTFRSWLDRTNLLSTIISSEVVTANGSLGVTTGNAFVNGTFSSITLAGQTIRGGNNSVANTLSVASNLAVNAHVTIANTLTVAANTTLGVFSATSGNVSGAINVSNTITLNSSTIKIGNSSSNAMLTGNSISVGNVFMNTTTLVVGATIINSTTFGESTNNANYLDEHSWEEPKEIGTIGPNTAIFTSVKTTKIIANNAQGTNGQILKANSSGGVFWAVGGEGYTGSVGYTGSSVRGYTGSQGTNGISGANGAVGFTGSRGSNGTPGDQGYTGSSGDAGSPGGRGYTGSLGGNGPLGYTGSIGPIGFSGSSGSALNGFTGSRGEQGFTGFTGSRGNDGSFGGTVTADINFSNAYNATNMKSLGVGTSASNSQGEIRAIGNITAYYSDERLKTKLENIKTALDKVKCLNGFYFKPNDIAKGFGYKDIVDVGVSAQEVQAILPEIVTEAPIDDRYLAVRYEKLIPLLIEAIKELADLVETNIAVR